MDASIYGNFSNNPVAPPVLTQVFSDKISDGSSRDLYVHCGVNLVSDPVNPVAPQFVTHGFSTVDEMNKGAGIWRPTTIIRRLPNFTHLSVAGNTVGQSSDVEDAVGAK